MKSKLEVSVLSVLGIVSILGFIGIILTSSGKTGWADKSVGLIFLTIGISMIIWGKVKSTAKGLLDGIQDSDEVSNTLTIIFGLVGSVVGGLTLIGITAPSFNTWKIVLSVIMIFVIAFQTWGTKR